MTDVRASGRTGTLQRWRSMPEAQRRAMLRSFGWIVLVTAIFVQALFRLMVHAANSDLHSHILLVPLIAAYLLHGRFSSLPAPGRGSVAGTVVAGAVGLAALAAALAWRDVISVNDYLALTTFTYIALIAAGGFLFLGAKWMAAAAFPVGFLIFMVPLPDGLVQALERASAAASTDAAAMYFAVSGETFVRTGNVIELPGIVLQVARECSGIRSSWVLFITSILASNLFLESRWRRLVLVAFVIPLGILRNGFRVFVIGMLCVHVGPHMIDSVLHHRGGPIFFALSLVPLFLLLWWLRRGERHVEAEASTSISNGVEVPPTPRSSASQQTPRGAA